MLEEKDLQAIAQLIDAKLAPINDRLDQMQATQDQMQATQDQMQGDLAHVKAQLGFVETVQVKMEAVQGKMRDDLTHIKARLDYDVDKRLTAINEGVDAIQETMISKSRVEQLEDDVIVLKTAFKAMAQRIAELEKAQ